MPKRVLFLSVLIAAICAIDGGAGADKVKPQVATLIINEYLADPPGSSATDLSGDANGDGKRDSTEDEFVELVNTGSAPLDIGGFTISDSVQVRFTFPSGKIIPPGEAAVVFGGGTPKGNFGNAAANGLVFAIGGSGLSLNNSGDTITVKDKSGALVDSLTYSSAEGNAGQAITRSPDITGGFTKHSSAPGSSGKLFSPGTRLNGQPFVSPDPVINSISPDSTITGSGEIKITITGSGFQIGAQAQSDGLPVSTTFINSSQLMATLGSAITNAAGVHVITVRNPDARISNQVAFMVLGSIGINEFLADPPQGLAGDANGDGIRDSSDDEFIEIVNRMNTPVDVSGYSIGDLDHVRFKFPQGTVIPAGEAAVIFGGGTPRGEFGNAAFNGLVFTAALSLNNGGDTITLRDRAGAVVESITYGSAEGNAKQSINRSPDVIGTRFVAHATISGGRWFSPGTRVNAEPFTVGPRINRINPDRATSANLLLSLTIEGSGFESGSVALINSTSIPTSFVSAGILTASVPAGVRSAPGAYLVEVRNPGGNRSNKMTLMITMPPPVLRSVVPSLVEVASQDFKLILSGANFEPSSVALVEGVAVRTNFATANELSAIVPADFARAPGVRRIRVRNRDGQESNELSFEVVPAGPRIAAISPFQAIAGQQGFTLTILGMNFRADSIALFDEMPLATSFTSATELRATVPGSFVGKIGLHSVKVQNGDGVVSNTVAFRVLAIAPRINSIEPQAVVEGSGDATITIKGEGFQEGAVVEVTEQRWPGVQLEAVFIDSNRLQARLTAEMTRIARRILLRVINSDFGVSNEATLSVLIKDALVINEFLADPPQGPAGDANGDGTRSASQDEFIEIVNRNADPIDISGYKLSDASSVRHVFPVGTIIPPFEAAVVFGGGNPTGTFGNAMENQLVFKASSGSLSLDNSGDVIKLEDASGHTIQEIRYGPAEGNANQSLNRDPDVDGANFLPHVQVAGSSGRLFSPGTRATGEPFTIKPSIRAIEPASIRAGSPAFVMTVSGANFLPGALVLFGSIPVATTYLSDGELQAQVEQAMIVTGGAVDVRVRNPKGELSGSARFLIIDDPPHIISISPQRTGTGAEDLEVTIEGEHFQRGAKVIVAGEAVETKFISSTSLVTILPDRFFLRAAELELHVVNADSNESNSLKLIVENGPLITRLSRERIRAGRGEIEIIVGGLAFKPGVVMFVNEAAVPTSFVSETVISARIPGELTVKAGLLVLQARNADGGRSNRATISVVE
jgi:hypothetical protein